MKNFFFFLLLIASINNVIAQESLLLGEIKRDEVKPDKVDSAVKKITVYRRKIRGLFGKKDSTVQSILDYNKKGFLVDRMSFFGKKNNSYFKEHYTYNTSGNVTNYQEQVKTENSYTTKVAAFDYNSKDQLVSQNISLATIQYEYYKDGRIKTKSYFYNSGDAASSEPWTHFYLYNDKKQLIHVDTDSSSEEQTSYYNEDGELIRHDYYQGYAYSLYNYDDNGNCIRQTDYELGKKGWDSTVFVFKYDQKDRLVLSSSSDKRGVIRKERKWIYRDDGKIDFILEYKKGRPKWRLSYAYEYNK